ncbi:hypothetical protein J6590_026612 [Homalodisca vitripennis]|nr:hypothetical protein J6590_026612 [Homalodisca vitripennis]
MDSMISPDAAKKLSTIPLLSNFVEKRITEMAQDIKDQLKTKLQKSEYISIQADNLQTYRVWRSLCALFAPDHPTGLREQLLSYIPEDQYTGWNWVLNPFNGRTVNEAVLNPLIHDKLIKLFCDFATVLQHPRS